MKTNIPYYAFSDVLTIVNGRNQRKVEDEKGLFPIYGSGGIMGWANDYICPENTVVIGRKGSINNPIFVEKKFWNVDTAFGLVAKRTILLPKYLYYFCVNFNFESLNTTVTIPSLTKANLLKVQIPIPSISEQEKIVLLLDKIGSLICIRKWHLDKLNQLASSRFIEMFGTLPDSVPLSHYIDSLQAGKSLAGDQECCNKVLKTGAVTYDYFDPAQVKNLPVNYVPESIHRVKTGDVIISRMNTAELVGATAYVWQVAANTFLPDRLWKAIIKDDVNPIFLWRLLIHPSVKKRIRGIAGGTSGSMKNISKSGLLKISVPNVDYPLQNEFASFIEHLDKSKVVCERECFLLEKCTGNCILTEGVVKDEQIRDDTEII